MPDTPDSKWLAKIAALIRCQIELHRSNTSREAQAAIDAVTVEMDRLKTIRRKIDVCIAKKWKGALESLGDDIKGLLIDMPSQIQDAERHLDACKVEVPPLRDIFADLKQAWDEFEEVDYDSKNRTLSVVTESIELEGVFLGDFEVQLHINRLGDIRRSVAFNVVALDPHPATASESVTHPHVKDERLCAGNATAAIDSALANGRICDFFMLVNSVLTHYNPDSPYVSLDNWEGIACHDCGYIVGNSDDLYFCPTCEQDFCGECSSYCHRCDESSCIGCLTTCEVCEDRYCSSCMTTCPDCGRDICKSCVDDEACPCKEEEPEQDQETKEEDDEHRDEGSPRSRSEATTAGSE
jgi:hypothetical protein